MRSKKLDVETCVIGKRTVGKTAFLNRLKDDHFFEIMLETNVAEHTNILLATSKYKYRLKITDIPGNLADLNEIFIEDKFFILLFFDLSNLEDSFKPILEYLRQIKKNSFFEKTIVLLGTKSDLVRNVGNYCFNFWFVLF